VQFAPGAPWMRFQFAIVVPLLSRMISVKKKNRSIFQKKTEKRKLFNQGWRGGLSRFPGKKFYH
jgi:hypothetical protein